MEKCKKYYFQRRVINYNIRYLCSCTINIKYYIIINISGYTSYRSIHRPMCMRPSYWTMIKWVSVSLDICLCYGGRNDGRGRPEHNDNRSYDLLFEIRIDSRFRLFFSFHRSDGLWLMSYDNIPFNSPNAKTHL